jgi:magnesium-transporting ATPase (P-type)
LHGFHGHSREVWYDFLLHSGKYADRVGHGSGIVVGTGKDTEFGVVFEMMQDVGASNLALLVGD